MTNRRSGGWIFTAALMLLASGCAGPPSGDGTSVASAGSGGYKIGRPYSINGRWYQPTLDYAHSEVGVASWYGRKFHGRRTANGERFDMEGLTAAHRTLPMPSVVRVTNLENGRSVRVRVNDRGPFSSDRVIDVSRHAAEILGFRSKGTARVKVDILPMESYTAALAAGGNPPPVPATVMVAQAPRPAPTPVAVAAPVSVPVAVPAPVPVAAPVPVPVVATAAVAPVSAKAFAPLPTPVRDTAPATQVAASTRWMPEGGSASPRPVFIQVGAFGSRDNAERMASRMASFGPVRIAPMSANGRELQRVQIGPFDSRSAADRVVSRLMASGQTDAVRIVQN